MKPGNVVGCRCRPIHTHRRLLSEILLLPPFAGLASIHNHQQPPSYFTYARTPKDSLRPQKATMSSVVQSTVEDRVLSRSDNQRMRVQDAFQECGPTADKANNENGGPGWTAGFHIPETRLENLFGLRNLVRFRPGIPRGQNGQFVFVPRAQMGKGLGIVFGFGVVVGEENVVETIENGGEVPLQLGLHLELPLVLGHELRDPFPNGVPAINRAPRLPWSLKYAPGP